MHCQLLRREAYFDMNQGNLLLERWEDMLKVEQIGYVLVHFEGEIEKHMAERLTDIENYCKQKWYQFDPTPDHHLWGL